MKLKRLDTPHGRVYLHKKGKEVRFLPSVTTILSSIGSKHLEKLEAELGKDKLQEIGQRAAGRGTVMHRFLENYFICYQRTGNRDTCLLYTQKKTPLELASHHDEKQIGVGRQLFYNLWNHLNNVHEVVQTEKFLASLEHGYAGTTDMIYINVIGMLIVCDFKSASGIRDQEQIDKYLMQVAAYVIAYEEETGKKIDAGEVLISYSDDVQVATLNSENIEDYKNRFIEATNKYHNQWDVEPIRQYYLENFQN